MSEYSRFRFLDPFIWFIAVLFILLLAFGKYVFAQPDVLQAIPVAGVTILQVETIDTEAQIYIPIQIQTFQ